MHSVFFLFSAIVTFSNVTNVNKYNLFIYFETWFHNSVFPCYEEWKSIVYHEMRNSEMNKWTEYCVSHPNLHVAKACIDNIPPQQFWSLTDQYPDLVRHLQVQVRLMGNLGLNAGVPWLSDTDGQKCFICKNDVEDAVTSFLIACPSEKTILSYGLT